MRQHYTYFRVLFGLYLFWHFYEVQPYAKELFTTDGMLSNSTLPTTFITAHLDFIETHIETFILTLMFCSVALIFGFMQTLTSLILWFGWSYLFNRNIFISNPGIPYVGLLLLVCAIGPEKNENIYWIMWFLMMMGYTVSGLHKLLLCQSWVDGTALYHVISSPIARDNILTSTFLSLPLWMIKICTWGSLVLEITSLPLGTFYHTRKWYWIALVGMHLGVLALINFTDLTIGMLMVHAFTFDEKWFIGIP